MDLKPRSGLRGLMSNRNKGQSSKDAPKEQVPAKIPPPPPPPPPSSTDRATTNSQFEAKEAGGRIGGR